MSNDPQTDPDARRRYELIKNSCAIHHLTAALIATVEDGLILRATIATGDNTIEWERQHQVAEADDGQEVQVLPVSTLRAAIFPRLDHVAQAEADAHNRFETMPRR